MNNAEIRIELGTIRQHLHNHDKNIELLFNYFDEMTNEKKPDNANSLKT